MKLFLILCISFSLNIFTGYLVNETLVDEFTDEESVALTFTLKTKMGSRWSKLLGKKDSDSWHFEDYIRVKFRFDKNQPFEYVLDFDSDSSFAYTYSEEIIFTVLKIKRL